MNTYRVQQRLIPASILTPSGWMTGRFHVGLETPFLESVNMMSDFIKLTHVRLPDGSGPLPFLALQRDAAHLLIPDAVEDNLHLTQCSRETEPRRVTCLLAQGSVSGELALVPDARVSDYLLNCEGFFVLRNATGDVWKPLSSPAIGGDALPAVLVNAGAVIGVAELEK